MRNYCYRIKSAANIPLCGGSVRAETMDEAFIKVMKYLNITIEHTYYDKDSLMAGCIFQTNYIMDYKKVFIFMSAPLPEQYKRQLDNG